MVYLLKLLLAGLISIPFSLIMLAAGLVDRRARTAYRLGRAWSKCVLLLAGIELRVSGAERLDASQAYLFMANHQSNLDIPALIAGLEGFQLCLVAKKDLLRIPVFGWGLRACRMITIERGSVHDARSSIERACQKLNEGVSVVVFPEGTRSPDGGLLPFKRGGFVIAQNARTPIVPITINGSRERLARGSWRVVPGVVEINVHAAIHGDELTDDSRELSAKVRDIIGARLIAAGPGTAPLSDLAGRAG